MTSILWHIAPYVPIVASSPDATAYSSLELNGRGQKDFELEQNYIILDGTFKPSTEDVNWWTTQIGTNQWVNPNMNPSPYINIMFSSPQTSGFTLLFDTMTGDYIRGFYCDFIYNGTVVETEYFQPNNAIYYCDYSGAAYNEIEIIVLSTLPLRRAKIDGIVFGEVKSFTGDEIKDATVVKDFNLNMETLPYGTATFTVMSDNDISAWFASRQRIDLWHNTDLIGIFYLQDAKRIAEKIWTITAVDGFGVLESMFYEGRDCLSGVSAKTLAADIINGSSLTLDASAVSDFTAHGLLMAQTCRGAFQQLLFRWGICARMEGDTLVLMDEPTASQKTLTADEVYNDAKIQTDAEHSSFTYTVRDYTQDANGYIECAGNKYTLTENFINYSYGIGGADNVATFNGATLVPYSEHLGIRGRMMAYYQRRNHWIGRFVWNGENLCDRLTFPTSWATLTGTINKITLKISGIVAAEVEALE